jgi:uracil-DNA glycosylase family 4
MTSPKQAFIEIARDVSAHLRYLIGLDLTEVNCSDRSLVIIPSWRAGPRIRGSSLKEIHAELRQCRGCALADKRNSVVLGNGNPRARLVFVGGIPEARDNLTGISYSGRAGELLTNMIRAMKLSRDRVYVCHVLKCHCGDVSPPADAIRKCGAALKRELSAVGPGIICTLGDLAAQTLLKTSHPVFRLRGRFHDYKGIRVMSVYAPEDMLKDESLKRPAWEDLQLVMEAYQQI